MFDTDLPYFKGARQLRNALTQILVPNLQLPITVRTRYGFSVVVTTATDEIDYNLLARGTYEAGTLHAIKACLKRGDTFLDIGANIGLMSLMASDSVGSDGSVYSFEPEPRTFNLLQENVRLNCIQNVSCHNLGLASSRDTLAIYRNRRSNRGTASFMRNSGDAIKTADVTVLTLDQFLSENQLSVVRMLKIDVEGWEPQVLQGAKSLLSAPEAPIVVVEYNTVFPSHRDIFDFLTSINDYQFYMLPHGNWHASKLVRISGINDLPRTGSPNLFCFLPYHVPTIPRALFK